MDDIAVVKQTCRQWAIGNPVNIKQLFNTMYQFDIYRQNPDHKVVLLRFMYDIEDGVIQLIERGESD
ncbi:MAG TPA: hypothetical protein DDW71_00560 [Lactobacillus sp.]|nr:hypothetical protein [Lactobacillus sp.]